MEECKRDRSWSDPQEVRYMVYDLQVSFIHSLIQLAEYIASCLPEMVKGIDEHIDEQLITVMTNFSSERTESKKS